MSEKRKLLTAFCASKLGAGQAIFRSRKKYQNYLIDERNFGWLRDFSACCGTMKGCRKTAGLCGKFKTCFTYVFFWEGTNQWLPDTRRALNNSR